MREGLELDGSKGPDSEIAVNANGAEHGGVDAADLHDLVLMTRGQIGRGRVTIGRALGRAVLPEVLGRLATRSSLGAVSIEVAIKSPLTLVGKEDGGAIMADSNEALLINEEEVTERLSRDEERTGGERGGTRKEYLTLWRVWFLEAHSRT